jgi:putative acetyltransferase
MLTIRRESTADAPAIRAVTEGAFSDSEFGHQGEAELIEQIRANCSDSLSLVACQDDDVVGHALFSPVEIRIGNRVATGKGLGPMSVAPSHQRRGVGESLVRFGLRLLTDRGIPFVVVLGHPTYYPRFGFQLASSFGIKHGFCGIPQDVFFIQFLLAGALPSVQGGSAYYRGEFGPQHADSD